MVGEIDLYQACVFASQWWSVMTWGDPGVCMYAFGSTGKVQSEKHRQQLLSWIYDHCMPIAKKNDVDPDYERDPDEDDPYELYYTQEEQLEMLADYIGEAPIEEVTYCAG